MDKSVQSRYDVVITEPDMRRTCLLVILHEGEPPLHAPADVAGDNERRDRHYRRFRYPSRSPDLQLSARRGAHRRVRTTGRVAPCEQWVCRRA